MFFGNYLNFIDDRIEKLKTAIFYNSSQSLLKFPTCIIKITGFDESGNIWFTVKKPYDDITDFDSDFQAELQFYNKSYSFYITVYGKATIIPEKNVSADEALIRFRIFKAKYYYSKRKVRTRFNITGFISSLFTYERGYHLLQLG